MLKTLGIVAATMGAMALAGCATMDDTPPTAEQKAACEKMLSEMGEGATHSHASDKTGAVNTMGMTHAQCRAMLKK
ncbi:MAG: hydroxylase [Phenylobacterium sp.]|uniref:hydroxylase n=1 Tax=Phenylobacterium sp. TaxID=1871053 RepID=UPI001A58328C|nr:hydroxylase [Phenylobacterium sp.]MBL8772391.1 hydroxylase [Phenylobacterium sp.]